MSFRYTYSSTCLFVQCPSVVPLLSFQATPRFILLCHLELFSIPVILFLGLPLHSLAGTPLCLLWDCSSTDFSGTPFMYSYSYSFSEQVSSVPLLVLLTCALFFSCFVCSFLVSFPFPQAESRTVATDSNEALVFTIFWLGIYFELLFNIIPSRKIWVCLDHLSLRYRTITLHSGCSYVTWTFLSYLPVFIALLVQA